MTGGISTRHFCIGKGGAALHLYVFGPCGCHTPF
jgi:hypothetical protein